MNNAKSLTSEFVAQLNQAADAEEFSFPLVAQQNFDQRSNFFPRVVVRQLTNRPRTIVSADQRSDNEIATSVGYQIEIYTQDTLDHEGVAYDKLDVGETLSNELIEWFWDVKGLPRTTWSPSSWVDDSTARTVFRVNGVVDKHGYIYRS